MPELAEVEHARRRWDVALNKPIREVLIPSPRVRVFRDTDLDALRSWLPGQPLVASVASGKQLLFRFGRDRAGWLGVHLGMSGQLRVEPAGHEPARHEHLLLRQATQTLVFHDPRHFGRVRFHHGADAPAWWSELAPSILGERFDAASVIAFLARRRRSSLKAVLLMQARFPGVGNWMADEILWRARLHPATPAGALDDDAATSLWRVVRRVARLAIETIDDDWNYPDSWLFAHRWEPGGRCPRCRSELDRDTVGGRTTCWCPRCQPAPRQRAAGR